ncbi:MAG: S41 family peptidase [Muribaculaceae bacterium]|nr:S41 family peptidase [Muribaculaceae bacterium]
MKRLFYTLIAILVLIPLNSCHDQVEWDNDPYGNFDALWSILDEHYCFFAYKDVDWQAVKAKYRCQIHDDITNRELFDLCSDMLKELQDGHTNLISTFDVSRYWIWEQYPINYDERLIDEYYLNFNYRRASGIKYQILGNNFAYMYYGDFASGIGDGNLDIILNNLAASDGLIIDVRNNGGGYLTNVETFVGRFIDERIYAGSIQHKTGTGHNDFSEPYDYYFEPAHGRVHYNKPIVVLANRGSFSATNNFVSIMKSLPNVTIVGDVTGGGCGLPFTSELPNGWSIRFSAAPITGPDGKLTEFGVEPDVKVDMTQEDIASGKDTILETAFEILKHERINN